MGLDIEAGRFVPDKNIHHTHEGSIGNLQNDAICRLMQRAMDEIDFGKAAKAEQDLLNS